MSKALPYQHFRAGVRAWCDTIGERGALMGLMYRPQTAPRFGPALWTAWQRRIRGFAEMIQTDLGIPEGAAEIAALAAFASSVAGFNIWQQAEVPPEDVQEVVVAFILGALRAVADRWGVEPTLRRSVAD